MAADHLLRPIDLGSGLLRLRSTLVRPAMSNIGVNCRLSKSIECRTTDRVRVNMPTLFPGVMTQVGMMIKSGASQHAAQDCNLRGAGSFSVQPHCDFCPGNRNDLDIADSFLVHYLVPCQLPPWHDGSNIGRNQTIVGVDDAGCTTVLHRQYECLGFAISRTEYSVLD